MIAKPRLGRLTQGSIFCGAFAEDYQRVPVWGIVITARCDTTHDKTPIVNYLPLVRIEDWLERHGWLLVLDRAYAELRNRFHNLLSQRGLSTSLTEVHDVEYLAKVHFAERQNATESKKTEKEAKDTAQARKLAAEMCLLSAALDASIIDPTLISRGVRVSRKTMQSVVKDLFSHQLSGYYYLPSIGDETELPSKHGYVALLREVHHLPRRTAKMLLDGIGKDDMASGGPLPGVSFDQFDLAYPVAEMQSPWVEHLMQIFCSLFGRIGVTDLDKARIMSIVNAIAPEKGNDQ